MENNWEKKATCSAYLSSKIFATSAWDLTRSTSLSSLQRSNWSPTYILHLFHLKDTSLLFLFISESVKVRFLPRVDTFSSDIKTGSHKRSYEYIWILVIQENNYDSDNFGSFLSKNRIFCSITRCWSSFYEGQYGKRQ